MACLSVGFGSIAPKCGEIYPSTRKVQKHAESITEKYRKHEESITEKYRKHEESITEKYRKHEESITEKYRIYDFRFPATAPATNF